MLFQTPAGNISSQIDFGKQVRHGNDIPHCSHQTKPEAMSPRTLDHRLPEDPNVMERNLVEGLTR